MAKRFLDPDFLLQNKWAERLYHEFAAPLPLIDYHNHLPPDEIAEDLRFQNLTRAWLAGDHYKWRAMRANGIDEKYITGSATDIEKFAEWARTVPFTVRNPLYHWTHLELQRYFGVQELLNDETAAKIYEQCSEQLASPEYSTRNLLHKMVVEVLCTTDDPVDSLLAHQKLKAAGFGISVLPTFRPDRAIQVDDPVTFNQYLDQLEAVSGVSVTNYQQFLEALHQRHDFFATLGCRLSDHGLEQLYAEDYTETEVSWIFDKLRSGETIEEKGKAIFKSAMLATLAEWDWEKGWVQQFHLGALRNTNTRLLTTVGRDSGGDSIGDFRQGESLKRFLDRLDRNNMLPKTILYNLNPADNALMATMAGNYNDGSEPGKMQWGAAWWYLDQKDGMEEQLNLLSNLGLISRFVGMLTDSRSFLSFPRHEYFRRILCNLFGQDIENGNLPDDLKWTGKIIQDICYFNAKKYFGF